MMLVCPSGGDRVAFRCISIVGRGHGDGDRDMDGLVGWNLRMGGRRGARRDGSSRFGIVHKAEGE